MCVAAYLEHRWYDVVCTCMCDDAATVLTCLRSLCFRGVPEVASHAPKL